jgi:hypothetical protein
MPTISCFYIKYNRDPINITFIKYDNYVKVILNRRAVILKNNQLISNNELFQIYLISLLLTEDTSTIEQIIVDDKIYYGVYTMRYWKNLYLTDFYRIISLEKSAHRNPLNTKEPKRASSAKKYNKFMRYFYNYYNDDYIINPTQIFKEFIFNETDEDVQFLKHQTQIEALTYIFHNYGRDVFSAINKYVKL